jgi:hypothetical protein
LKQYQFGGRVAPVSRAERHVHTVRLAVDSRYGLPVRAAASVNLITDGLGSSFTRV